eukprot:sb/3477713/
MCINISPSLRSDDILHISTLLRKVLICGNNAPLAGRVIQIHTGVIAHIYTSVSLTSSLVLGPHNTLHKIKISGVTAPHVCYTQHHMSSHICIQIGQRHTHAQKDRI